MPELPEVETVARTLAPHVVGKKICAIHVLNSKTWQGDILPASVVSSCKNPLICSTGRRGKLLLVNLGYPQEVSAYLDRDDKQVSSNRQDNFMHAGQYGNEHGNKQDSEQDNAHINTQKTKEEKNKRAMRVNEHAGTQENKYVSKLDAQQENTQIFALAFHLKMTGRVFPYPKGTAPTKHTRLIIDLEDGTRIFFDDVRKFGYVRALSKESLVLWDFWQKLGPDPFEMTSKEFASLLSGRSGNIKSLILNQQLVSGIGNIYADEGLFRAKIHPQQRTRDLSAIELEKLHGCMVDVLEESIKFCGSSIRDYRTANGDVGSFQNKFYVYNRAGEQCKNCDTIISKVTVAGRTTNFCSCCQPLVVP